jgi:pimeloyl-ACP methyl ester carboxylesterase
MGSNENQAPHHETPAFGNPDLPPAGMVNITGDPASATMTGPQNPVLESQFPNLVTAPVSDTLFRDRTTAAAWRSRPAWYAVSRQDRTIPPGLQRFLAGRMEATAVEIDPGHLSLITHPGEVTQLIMDAILAVRGGSAPAHAPASRA